ncbi:MAG: 2-oxoacid:acceptor oxidoreductase subunit alpha [Firmicutes bacterium]|nr:2-oxoacid:acceptor oxidoreductase subunit alpha [Bacillota bacterium]
MITGKRVLLQGNEACVEGALMAGMRFFAGYPITPSTEIAEQAALRLPMVGGKFIQMEDEIAAMAAVIGASAAGLKSMTATSGPGFSLKQENIGYAALTEIPCVIVNVQRCGPSTGFPTQPSQGDVMQAKWGTHGDHPIIAIAPATVAETYTQIIRAFNLSEKYRVPVIYLMDEIVGHLREGITLLRKEDIDIIDRKTEVRGGKAFFVPEGELVPSMPPFGQGFRYNITGLMHNESGFPTNSAEIARRLITRLMRKIDDNLDDIIRFEERNLFDAETALVCYGGTTRSVVSAMESARDRGIKAGMFRPITIWPFPDKQIAEIAKKAKRIIVVEHNYGQILREVERAAAGQCEIKFLGKIDGTVILPDEVLETMLNF